MTGGYFNSEKIRSTRVLFRQKDPPGESIEERNSEEDGKLTKGVVEKEEAQIGVFITLKEPTKPMKVEAVLSGYYKSALGHNYPEIQILTIKQLLDGKRIDYPSRATGIDVTFRKAERHEKESKQKEMEFE
ncbi:unnamed protein product [marine sediment metagenome]|uniref:Uncharacterized protein n=1 Tax=marine sediment metagenome TaxID=412755 RepID=X1HX86_9ZZZZ